MLIPDRKMLVLTKEVIRDCHQCHSTLSALDSKCLHNNISFVGIALNFGSFSVLNQIKYLGLGTN